MPVRYTTASRSVFDGIVPVLTHTPPNIRPRSTTATDLPSFAAAIAAFCPPGPEPMTTRSYSIGMTRGLRRFAKSRTLTASKPSGQTVATVWRCARLAPARRGRWEHGVDDQRSHELGTG